MIVTYQGGVNLIAEEWLSKHVIGGWRNLAYFSFLFTLEGEYDVIGENIEIPVVDEFPDVFPDELHDLPPDREIEFCIDLLLGRAPISIAPYWMAPVEMEKLRKQLSELVEKGYIRNNTSLWGAPYWLPTRIRRRKRGG